MPSLAAPLATADCTDPGNPIHDLCRVVGDHSGGGSSLTIAILSRVVWPGVVLGIALILARIVQSITVRSLERTAADAQIRTLVENVLFALGVVVAVGAALTAEGLDLNIFLTLGGLGTLAVSLAFQDLLRNVLAGILLLVERPFRIGDQIMIDTMTGTVATIELRTTALRLPDGRLAIIPNLDAFTHTIVNLSAFELRQYTVTVMLPDGTHLEPAIAAARQVLVSTPEAAREPPPRVVPAIDAEGRVQIQGKYWLDYRTRDADAVSAAVFRRLHAAIAGEPLPEVLSGSVAAVAPEEEPEEPVVPPRPRRRRRLRPTEG